jgi:hypothetical protein
MVKKIKTIQRQSKTDRLDEEQEVGATASLRDRLGESGAVAAEPMSGREELRLNDPERATLAEIGKRLGRKMLGEVACIAKHDTIFARSRRLVA